MPTITTAGLLHGLNNVGPWVLGLFALFVAPFVVVAAGLTVLKDATPWVAIYWAGALGGLVLELMRGKWRVELPSRRDEAGADEAKDFEPHGPRFDIGFLGRMTTGGLAAPVFLILYSAIVDKVAAADLRGIAEQMDTFAWAVLFGFASPGAWAAGEEWIKSRLAVVKTTLDKTQEALQKAEQDLQKTKQELTDTNTSIADLTGKVTSVLGTQADVMKQVSTANSFMSLVIDQDPALRERIREVVASR